MYHAVKNAKDILLQNGFEELFEKNRWHIKAGGKYFVCRNSSSVIAFICGDEDIATNGFRIIGSHTDSPGFKIKPGNCIVTHDGYVQLNTEPYGGSLMTTWFDRPLSLAGRVFIKGEGVFDMQEYLIDVDRPILMIPNLCIHFNRNANENISINKQTDMLPLLCLKKKDTLPSDYIIDIIKTALKKIGIVPTNAAEDILDYELFLYESDKGSFVGSENEFLSASRIDNLSMLYCSLIALTDSQPSKVTRIMASFDNEEVGSNTANGANSSFLNHILKRVCTQFSASDEDYFQALAHSFAVSADTGHAVHPNYSNMHDPTNRPVLGGGPIIKYSANQRYVTDAKTAALFKNACKKAGVPCQNFVLRSDISGGSTIGPALSAQTSIPTVDVGTAILAMHSIREFASVADNIYTKKAFSAFYNAD